MDKDLHIKIESYLGGSMSLQEHEAFEKEIALDKNLQDEVSLFQSINMHLNEESWENIDPSSENKSVKDLQSYFKSEEALAIKEKIRATQVKYSQPKKTSFFKYASIAAVGILFVTISYFSFFNSNKDLNNLYQSYYSESDLPAMITRSSTSNDALTKGVVAYKRKEYKQALTYLNTYDSSSKEVDPLMYAYKGMAYLQLGESILALNYFQQLYDSNSLDHSKGLWYQCLVYMKTNNKSQLKSTLQQIVAHPSYFNYNKAKELLGSL